MRYLSKSCFLAAFTFILGCSLSLAVYSNYISLQCEREGLAKRYIDNSNEMKSHSSYEYLVLILSGVSNTNRRNVIRNTWLNLLPNKYIYFENKKEKWNYYFVIGTSNLSEQELKMLYEEDDKYNDLLLLPHLKDEYNTLTLKVLESLKWAYESNSNLLYVLKCDDDSFVRMDLILNELHIMRRKELKHESQNSSPPKSLYWGYFNGNARVQKKGKWSEKDFLLCDRYLPYAQGGGYVLSHHIVEFIGRNAQHLKLFKSEDVSVGVWTAPLSNVNRLHDVRFDTEWESRGCDDSTLIRHKQTPEDMLEMYNNLLKTGNTRLCSKPIVVRNSYHYDWTVPPSQCCSNLIES